MHRASEGAPYNGLKPAGTDPGFAVRDGDKALESADIGHVVGPMTQKISQEIGEGLRPTILRVQPTHMPGWSTSIEITLRMECKKPRKRRCMMGRYVCDVCGYVYDPAVGDPENGVPQGTPFEKLPEDWVCPLCGVGKEAFTAE